LVARLGAVFQCDERVDCLACQLVVDADDGSLGDRVCIVLVFMSRVCYKVRTVLDQRSLNLGSRQSVSRDVYNIVDTSSDPVVALVVTASTVSSELSLSAS
jgi:hypothetical protein